MNEHLNSVLVVISSKLHFLMVDCHQLLNLYFAELHLQHSTILHNFFIWNDNLFLVIIVPSLSEGFN
jgi:hypothetical protein